MKKTVLAQVILLAAATVSFEAFAAGAGGAHDLYYIPWDMVIPQAVNVILVIALLTYLLRNKVSEHFQTRASEFKQQIQKAEKALREAEDRKRVISERLSKLKSNANTDLERAKSEAEELRKKIVRDAEVLSKRLEADAARTVEFEVQRAKNRLREDLLRKSVGMAKETLVEEIDAPALKRLRSEFVEKIQVVQ